MELNGAKILYTIHTDIPLIGSIFALSIGKDSSVMVRLAEKAFAPGKVP